MGEGDADGVLDEIAAYGQVLAWVGARVAGIGADDLGRPTPCDKWDVGDVVVHVLGVIDYYAGLAETGDARLVEMARSELIGLDIDELYRRRAARALELWGADGALPRSYRLRAVGPRPGTEVLAIHTSDILIHGWDVAVATGQDSSMDAAVASFALAALRRLLPSDQVRGSFFGPEQPVPGDADVETRLLAYSGRRPPVQLN